MNTYFDIETIPGQRPGLREEIAETIRPPGNYSKPDTIARWELETKPELVEEAYRKTALTGDRGEIICIGWAIDAEPVCSLIRTLDDPEADLLNDFFNAIRVASEAQHGRVPFWIGHNLRNFDLPVLYQRAVILNIRPPFWLPFSVGPGSDKLYDTMTAWAGWGNRISLDRLMKALGRPGKPTIMGEKMDGSRVWDLVQAGRYQDVATYCQSDVDDVRYAYRRMTFTDVAA
jgi:3'-5' exonuclease